MSDRAHVVVIGAGVGGLAAALRLRALGFGVTVCERARREGGKMRELLVGGRPFDAGPSVLTMPQVFEELFAAAGARLEDYVRLVPVEPACRHFFSDGTVLDLWNDEPGAGSPKMGPATTEKKGVEPWERSAEEIRRVLGAPAAEAYRRFRRHAAELYAAVEEPFLQCALPPSPLLLPFTHSFRTALSLGRVDSRRTMWRALCRYFDEPHLRVLFARYATYCGSDPFLAPATLNVIPHVELGFGLHTVEGGMYRLAEALAALARERGVAVRLDADVERVELDERERRAVAVHIGGERLEADAVICNGDVAQLPHRLLAGTRWAATHLAAFDGLPPSLSAFVHLAVARSGDSRLRHHNVFFSDDYPREFEALTARHEAPDSPTVYLCAPDHAEVGSQRWFFLSNAAAVPAGDLAPSVESWGAEATRCRARLGVVLAHHGLALDGNVLAEQSVTPADFAGLFPSSRGSLYGAASNSRTSAFKRPPNRVRGLANLYCVGGSTHPGAGVPMVALSARITAGLIDRSL